MTGVGRGRLVAFEGGEAGGKSTQAARLAARLGAVLTREPGGTEAGERIRALLLDRQGPPLDPRTEALLMAAARAQHVAQVVEPALASGRTVVTDRFGHSSIAYQGHGRGLDPDEVARLSSWASGGLWPDVVVLLEVPRSVAAARLGRLDRFEAAGEEFHERVAAGFARLAAADPHRWVVIDGTRPPDAVEAAIWDGVRERVT